MCRVPKDTVYFHFHLIKCNIYNRYKCRDLWAFLFRFRRLRLQLFQPLQSCLSQIKDDTWNTESEHFSPTSVFMKTIVVWKQPLGGALVVALLMWPLLIQLPFLSRPMRRSGNFWNPKLLTKGFYCPPLHQLQTQSCSLIGQNTTWWFGEWVDWQLFLWAFMVSGCP